MINCVKYSGRPLNIYSAIYEGISKQQFKGNAARCMGKLEQMICGRSKPVYGCIVILMVGCVC